jgi:hypothetical protein
MENMSKIRQILNNFFPKSQFFYDKFQEHHLQQWSVCAPPKIFFTCKFSYIGFCKPANKTETGIANRWWTTNSKPPGPIIMMDQSETLSSSQIILIALFCAGAQFVQLC